MAFVVWCCGLEVRCDEATEVLALVTAIAAELGPDPEVQPKDDDTEPVVGDGAGFEAG
jgi:hypothetical protein